MNTNKRVTFTTPNETPGALQVIAAEATGYGYGVSGAPSVTVSAENAPKVRAALKERGIEFYEEV